MEYVLAIIFGSLMSVALLKIIWWFEAKANKDEGSWL